VAQVNVLQAVKRERSSWAQACRVHLYMEMFSIIWLDTLSHKMIPWGDTFRATLGSFFPLALA